MDRETELHLKIAERRAEAATVKARFVGGPWHNRLVNVPPKAHIFVDLNSADAREPGRPAFIQARYSRCYFKTDRETVYMQYVHDSLIDSAGRPAACASMEAFDHYTPSMKRGPHASEENPRSRQT